MIYNGVLQSKSLVGKSKEISAHYWVIEKTKNYNAAYICFDSDGDGHNTNSVTNYKVNFATSKSKCTYTQHHLIRTTVNFLLVMVLIFSQNFTSNGPYVVLNFCEFSDTMVLIFWKMSCFLSKELESVFFMVKINSLATAFI